MSRILPLLSRWFVQLAAFGMMLACLAAAPASAQEWAVDKTQSQITFQGSAGGQVISGQFTEYQAEIRFDPDEPKEAEINAAIAVNSISTGQDQVDKSLVSADWFDMDNYPVASFRAVSVKMSRDGKYEILADLSIKGVTKRVRVPFSLNVSEGEALARAEVTLNRQEFRLGPTGPVSDMIIDDPVTVVIALAAKRLDN